VNPRIALKKRCIGFELFISSILNTNSPGRHTGGSILVSG
jgi:hypothetical protein